MADYYVDATGGLDANDGLSTGSAWQTISKVNGETFTPGDNIHFKAGETWAESLQPPSSGSLGSVITFGKYSTGADPVINLEGLTGACVLVSGQSYIEVNDFDLIGSGDTGAFRIQLASGAGGYTVKARRVDILRNYASTNGDGFSTDNTAELELINCSADKCREAGAGAGSHQCVAPHGDSKVLISGSQFTDSNFFVVAIDNSTAEFNSCSFSGARVAGFGTNGIDTATVVCKNSIIDINVGGGLCENGSSGNTVVTLENNTITTTSSKLTFVRAFVNLYNNTITVNDAIFQLQAISGGAITVTNKNNINITTGRSTGLFRCGDSSSVSISKNTITANGNVIAYWGNTTAGSGEFNYNIVTESTGKCLWIAASCSGPPDILNNVFYNAVLSGVVLDNDGPVVIFDCKNNIFQNITDPIAGLVNISISNNCYFNSIDEGGAGSITTDPLFIDTTNGVFRVREDSPVRGAGVDVGFIRDFDGATFNPPPSLGVYDFGKSISTTVGVSGVANISAAETIEDRTIL